MTDTPDTAGQSTPPAGADREIVLPEETGPLIKPYTVHRAKPADVNRKWIVRTLCGILVALVLGLFYMLATSRSTDALTAYTAASAPFLTLAGTVLGYYFTHRRAR